MSGSRLEQFLFSVFRQSEMGMQDMPHDVNKVETEVADPTPLKVVRRHPMPRGRPPGGPKTGGRTKGALNKATVAREVARLYTSEAIEALRSVCADSSADETARVQAARMLLDLSSDLLQTKGALSAQDLMKFTSRDGTSRDGIEK